MNVRPPAALARLLLPDRRRAGVVDVSGVGRARGALVEPFLGEGGQRCTDPLVRAGEKHAEDDPVALARVDGDAGAGEGAAEELFGADAVALGKETLQRIRENVVVSLVTKAIMITLAGLGVAPLWLAIVTGPSSPPEALISALRVPLDAPSGRS